MSDTHDDPGAQYPRECAELMERTMKCVADGDIPGALRLQTQVSECLVRHGYDEPPEMPAEYYMLMHKGIAANRAGDYAEVERIRGELDRMADELLGPEGPWGEEEGDTTITPIPEDCIDALRAYMQALNEGQWDEARRLAADLQQSMESRGLPPLPLFPPGPEETGEPLPDET